LLVTDPSALVKKKSSAQIRIVLTPVGRYYEEAVFDDENEKDNVYGVIAERAK
jgi:hypothetical protein